MKKYTLFIIICISALLSGCTDRRNLWVLADEYHQVELVTDWSMADERPDGMTAWFIGNDYSGYTRNFKTAEVDHSWLSLPRGNYTGLVFDYSPEEYGHLQFVEMDNPDLAEVCLKPSFEQPIPGEEELFGDIAVSNEMKGLEKNEATGLYVVMSEPDPINLDVLEDVNITSGAESDYIKWKDREEYESKLVTQTLNAQPEPIVWKLHILVNVRGIYYLHNVRASIAGLADGYLMGQGLHSEEVCLQTLNNWESRTTGDNVGYISTDALTFGLPETSPTRADDIHNYYKNLRLNLSIMLRDQETVLHYHFDCSPYVNIYDDQLVVRIDIPIELGPDLPYVDAKGSAGFDATVTPWEDGGTADTTM